MINQLNEFDINNYIENLPVLEDTTFIEENITTSNRSLSKLKIALWNCRGLCTPSKRNRKLTHMLSKNQDINILTETKLREKNILTISSSLMNANTKSMQTQVGT